MDADGAGRRFRRAQQRPVTAGIDLLAVDGCIGGACLGRHEMSNGRCGRSTRAPSAVRCGERRKAQALFRDENAAARPFVLALRANTGAWLRRIAIDVHGVRLNQSRAIYPRTGKRDRGGHHPCAGRSKAPEQLNQILQLLPHLDIRLPTRTEHTDELAEALYEAGCDDGSVWSLGGRVQIGFTRRTESLEAAIRSAISDVQKAGSTVVQVTIEEGSLAALASMA